MMGTPGSHIRSRMQVMSVLMWTLDVYRQNIPLGQKIEAVEGIVPVRRSLVGRCAAIGMMQPRSGPAHLGYCELHLQKQA